MAFFSISERNAGNDVRRVGEEGLFEMLVEKNSTAMSKCKFQTIVTTDPHTFNTLKNEYPANGNERRPIMHYTELLDKLISDGKLRFTKNWATKSPTTILVIWVDTMVSMMHPAG